MVLLRHFHIVTIDGGYYTVSFWIISIPLFSFPQERLKISKNVLAKQF
jgi:hypothetical protein